MPFRVFTFNAFQENTYLLWNHEKDAILIDPGMQSADEEKELLSFLNAEELTLVDVLLTHAHIDHILGCDFIFQRFGLKPKLFKDDFYTFSMAKASSELWNIPYKPAPEPISFDLNHPFNYGSLSLETRLVPGHSQGHVIFINHAENIAIVGDTVFKNSIGRTDLPGGNHHLLLEKIKSEILNLPENMTLFPGHGPETTVGEEKVNNPFLI